MKYTLLTLLTAVFPFISFAQTATVVPELESDRPNFTQGATVVPHKTIQIEIGLDYTKDESDNIREKDFTYPTTLIRVGIFKKAEFRLEFDFEQDKYKYLVGTMLSGLQTKEIGFNNVRIGTKIALVEGQGIVPAIAVLGDITLPVGNKEFRPPHVAPEGRLLFNNRVSEKLNLQYNIGYQKHRDDDEYRNELLYSASAALNFTHNLMAFAEFQAIKPMHQPAENSVDAGVMCKLLPNLQLDLYAGAGVSKAAPDFYTGAGITWRVPH